MQQIIGNQEIMRHGTSEKLRVLTLNNEASITKQNLKDNADINKIIKKYQKTGVLTNLNQLEAMYGEITSDDLQDSLEKLNKSHEAFMSIPSEIRKRFNNDAGQFIDFATNPDNLSEMQQLGLAPPPPPEPEPIEVVVTNTEANSVA